MVKHCMVDIETLASSPDAAIIAIGATTFDPSGSGPIDTFYCAVDGKSAQQYGSIDAQTIAWWFDQTQAARDAWIRHQPKLFLPEALLLLDHFYRGKEEIRTGVWAGAKEPCARMWSHGATFDAVVLAHAYKAVGLPMPWGFRDVRDTRTLFELFPPEWPTNLDKHNALADAVAQTIAVQSSLARYEKACYKTL